MVDRRDSRHPHIPVERRRIMPTLLFILILAACGFLVAAILTPRIPWWVSVRFLCLLELARYLK
jgi:uncharacterized membrane protein YdbT with pleckstrin-like domain